VVFFPLEGSPAAERAKGYGLDTTPLPSFGLAALARLKGKPDRLIAYGGPETLLIKTFRGEKWRFRGQEVERGLIGDAKQRIGLAGIDAVIAPSVALAQQLDGLVPPARLKVVPLGIDTEAYRRVGPAPAGERPQVVVLGRLDPVKGHAALLELMAKVWDGWEGPARPLLHIVGEPANLSEAELRQMVSARRVEADVKLTVGRVADVARLLSEAALGVVPSLGSEVICRVAEEFLACGTPIVVSGVGSLGEVLFQDAGASYGGCPPNEAVGILRKWIMRGATEGEKKKQDRAAAAQERFSLAAMGLALEKL
jgi:glycosyltransferase involved in cell wall biosynthesis